MIDCLPKSTEPYAVNHNNKKSPTVLGHFYGQLFTYLHLKTDYPISRYLIQVSIFSLNR